MRSLQDGTPVHIALLMHKKEINQRLGEGHHKGSMRLLPPTR
jgi:hypothetical protein